MYVMHMKGRGKVAVDVLFISVNASFYKVLFVLHLWNSRQDMKIYGQVKHRKENQASEKGE